MENYRYIVNVAFVGPSNSGKTTLINILKGKCFNQTYNPTIGLDLYTLNYKNYIFQLWDISGSHKFKILLGAKLKNSDIIFLCYEYNQMNSLIDMINIYEDNIQYFDGKKVVILQTKSDLDLTLDSFLVDLELQKFNCNNYMKIIKTSSKIKQNLNLILDTISDFCIKLDKYLYKNDQNISLLSKKNNNKNNIKNNIKNNCIIF